MSFAFVLLTVFSLFLLIAIIGISFFKWKVTGAIHFGILICFTFIWSVGTFIELGASSLQAKLFWRNFTQIGTFFLPAATVVFALAHTGSARRVTRYVGAILYGWQVIPLLLIWTNGLHHLMRVSVGLGAGFSGLAVLVVRQTVLGMVYVSINYAMMVAAVLILLVSAVRRPAVRSSLLVIAAGLAIPSVFTSLTNLLGPLAFGGIPAAMSFAIGGVIALVGIQYFGFLKLTPIARDRAFDVIDEGILVCDTEGKVVDLNPAARKMLSRNYPLPNDAPAAEFGYRLAKTLNVNIPELCAQKELRFSIRQSDSDADIHYLLRSYELRNDRKPIGYTSVLQDVSDDTYRMNQLLARAERDPLTGIYNKQAFNEIVISLLGRIPLGSSFLMILDIDNFKKFNDEYGHLSGDIVIQEVCRRCQESLRDHDIFGRVGGDEFALFLTGLDAEAARILAERIRQAVSSQELALGKQTAAITISVGIAGAEHKGPRDTPSCVFEAMFEKADAALYQSKAAGRDSVSFSA